ncbi:outer membrane protein assembly factor BamB family protein [Halolamina salifodinae]|uniref:Glucose dehydrogenase n=1 Tax=Halolamina salifodinae TaxID=1202767 RepID=A0A8T4GZ72_9EURY|nr:PQQ-binding-like beta-propeller repeat protein [Halolamina salifodinae]MBP1986675.1 glucose dehydrogenase [Halolamina salifodinae]
MSEQNEPETNSLSARDAAALEGAGELDPEERSESVDTGAVSAVENVTLEQEAPGSAVTDDDLVADVDSAESWLAYNKGLEQTGYSPADRITTENVTDLEREYVVDTDTSGMQTTPIVVPGGEGESAVMYFTQQNNKMKAVDARTGDLYWEYAADGEQSPTVFPWNNRGFAVYGDLVVTSAWGEGDSDRLIALDRYTGEFQWETDLIWPEEELPEELSDYPPQVAGLTQAPMAYDGKIFTGVVTNQVRWGWVQAFDAETGEVLWRETLVPPEEWIEDTWAYGNSVNWMNATIDPVSETVLFNTGDPAGWYNSSHRPGPNKHSVSVLAFDFDGEMKWSKQLLAHELWDYDAGSISQVADVTIAGEERRAVMANTKEGWAYVLDIEDGKLLQRSEPVGKQEHRYGSWPDSEFLNMVPIGKENAGDSFPGTTGGTEWLPDAYSPRTNYRYVSGQDMGMTVYGAEGDYIGDVTWEEGVGEAAHGGAVGVPDDKQSSQVVAIDINTGEIAWKFDFAELEEFVSFTPSPTATAGGLVFAPSRGGHLAALDDESGDLLWSDQIEGQSITSTPISWDDPETGKQYVGIAADSKVVVYSLEADVQQATETVTETETETATEAAADTETATETTSTDGPGLGVGAGAAGVGGYAAKKLRDSDDGEDDDE